MSREDQGWVSIHRVIQSHWLWEDKPFSRGQAWIDLILLANHEDRTVFFDGKPEKVTRGSFLTSISRLMERWGWGNRKVLAFLSQLEKDGMLVRIPKKRCTSITIVNYGVYQGDVHRSCIDLCTDKCIDACTDLCIGSSPGNTGVCRTSLIDLCTDKCTDVCTANCTQTINKNNTVTVSVSAPQTNQKSVLPEDEAHRELFAYAKKLMPGNAGLSELRYIIDKGATDRLIRWAIDTAAEKGKLWSYARGILMNRINSGQLDIQPQKPVKASRPKRQGGSYPPSYDIEEMERSGLQIPEVQVTNNEKS